MYKPAESSPVQSHESCQVKSLDAACFIFVSQTPRAGRKKLILLVKDHEAITTPRVVNTGTTSYFDDDDVHNNKNNSTTNNSNNVLIVIRPSI
jgi:hypothetical protein